MASKRGGRARARGQGGARRYVISGLILVALVGALYVVLSRLRHAPTEEASTPPPPAADTTALPPSRSVVLFFGREEADGLYRELREIRASEGIEEGVSAVVGELIRGPGKDAVPSIPPQATLRRVLLDARSGVLYLDFSRELQTEHWGGSEGELLTVRSLLQTIAANFPTVKAVQILVEGKEIESIAGHVDASKPFDLASWMRADHGGPEGEVFEEPSP